MDWRAPWLPRKQVLALVDVVPLRTSLLVLKREILLCPGTAVPRDGKGKPSRPFKTTLYNAATRQRQTTNRNYQQFIFFVFCGIGNSNISPAWSPRSCELAAPGLTVGYSIGVQRHIFKTWMVRFSFPCAWLNKVMSEWVQSLAGLAMFLCRYLQGCYIIVS